MLILRSCGRLGVDYLFAGKVENSFEHKAWREAEYRVSRGATNIKKYTRTMKRKMFTSENCRVLQMRRNITKNYFMGDEVEEMAIPNLCKELTQQWNVDTENKIKMFHAKCWKKGQQNQHITDHQWLNIIFVLLYLKADERQITASPPLKKRSTRRGLARSVVTESQTTENTPKHVTQVYSTCVERLFSCIDNSGLRVPLNLKNDSNIQSGKPADIIWRKIDNLFIFSVF